MASRAVLLATVLVVGHGHTASSSTVSAGSSPNVVILFVDGECECISWFECEIVNTQSQHKCMQSKHGADGRGELVHSG
jgi:hypothetical protein